MGRRDQARHGDGDLRLNPVDLLADMRRGGSYKELASRLEAIGIRETERNINNKISRGDFSAAFLVQCLKAIGCTTLHLEDV